MSDDDLRIKAKGSSTAENRSVKSENKDTKPSEVKPAELQVGQELVKSSGLVSDAEFGHTIKKREEQQRTEEMANIADIASMADLPEDNVSADEKNKFEAKPSSISQKEAAFMSSMVLKEKYERVENDFTAQLKYDGWTGDVADAFSKIWNNKLYGNANGNTADLVREDLAKFKRNMERLNTAAQLGTTTYSREFKKIFGVDFNPSNITAYKEAEELYFKAATAKMQEDNFNKRFKYLLENDTLKAEYKTMKQQGEDVVYHTTPKENVFKREENSLLSILGDKGKEILESKYKEANAKTIEDKYKVLRFLVKINSAVLNNATKEACAGKDYSEIEKHYNHTYKAAYGNKNDIAKRVNDYNISQQKGAGIVQSVAVIGAVTVAGLSMGTATPFATAALISAGTATAATAAVNVSDRFTSGTALDELKNKGFMAYLKKGAEITDWNQVATASVTSGAMCLVFAGQSYAVSNLCLKAGVSATSAAVVNSAAFIGTGLGTEKLLTGEITVEGATFTVLLAVVGGALQIKHIKKMEAQTGAAKEAKLGTDISNARQTMGFSEDAIITPEQLDAQWKAMARKIHPDAGGSDIAMAALNSAHDTLKANIVRINDFIGKATKTQVTPQKQPATQPSVSTDKVAGSELVPAKMISQAEPALLITAPQTASTLAEQAESTAAPLTTDEKMQILSEKMVKFQKHPLSKEDFSNENIRANVDRILTYLEYCESNNRSMSKNQLLMPFSKHVLNVSPECLKTINLSEWNPSVFARMCTRGFPMELLNLSFEAAKTIEVAAEFTPTFNLGTDKANGKSLIQWYQDKVSQSGEINNSLRQGKCLSEKAKELMRFFDSHQRPLGKNMGLIRGTTDYPGLEISKLKPGDEFTDKGFASTMHIDGIPQVIDAFPDDFGNFEHFLIIKTPATQKVIVPADWTGVDNMGEIILPRGTKFRVLENVPLTDYGSRGHAKTDGRRAVIVEIVDNELTPQTLADKPAAVEILPASNADADPFADIDSAMIADKALPDNYPAEISGKTIKLVKDNARYNIYDKDGKQIGYCELSDSVSAASVEDYLSSAPESWIENGKVKPSLEILAILINNNERGKGYGIEAIQKLYELSVKLGYEGRLQLEELDMANDFYTKLGFSNDGKMTRFFNPTPENVNKLFGKPETAKPAYKLMSRKKFIQKILSHGKDIQYTSFIFECLEKDGETVREDILEIIEKNYAIGVTSESMTRSLVKAYKKQPELITQWVEKGVVNAGDILKSYEKNPQLTLKAIDTGMTSWWDIQSFVDASEGNPELAIKCIDKGIKNSYAIESIIAAFDKNPDWTTKLLDMGLKYSQISDISELALENPEFVQMCLDAGIKESYPISNLLKSHKINPEITKLFIMSGNESYHQLERLLKLAETNPLEVKSAISLGYSSSYDVEYIIKQGFTPDELQMLKDMNLPLHTSTAVVKALKEHSDITEKYMQLNSNAENNKDNLKDAGILFEKITPENREEILEIINYLLDKKYNLVIPSWASSYPLDNRVNTILNALKNKNWKILLDKCMEQNIPADHIPEILERGKNLDLALDIIENCKYKESVPILIRMDISNWREGVKLAEKHGFEKVESGIAIISYAQKNNNIDIEALLSRCKQLNMKPEHTLSVLATLSYSPNLFPLFESCLNLGICKNVEKVMNIAFGDINSAHKIINLFRKYNITDGDAIFEKFAPSRYMSILEYYFKHGIKTAREISEGKNFILSSQEDFVKSITDKINISKTSKYNRIKCSSTGTLKLVPNELAIILNLFDGLTPEAQAAKIQDINKTIESMKQRRDQLKSGLEDLPDKEIEEFVLDHYAEIEKAKKLLGDSAFLDAYGLKMDGLEDLIQDIDLLYESLTPENLEKILETFAPTESQKGKRIAKIVKQLNARNSELAKIRELAKKKPVMDIYNARKKKLTAQLYERQKVLKSMNSKDRIEKLKLLAAMKKIAPKSIDKFIRIINDKGALTRAVNEEIFKLFNMPFDETLSAKLGLDKSEFLTTIATSSQDFKDNLKILIETIRNNPDMSIDEALDTLPQNISTRETFEKLGLDYARWIHSDKNSFETVQVTVNGDKAKAAAIKSLEKDFNDDAFKLIPKEESEKIFTALKNKGITLEEECETLFDRDGFAAGTKKSLKLKYNGELITFDKLEEVISVIKEVMNNSEFWTISHPDASINEAKNTIYNHIVKLRANELDIAKNAKGEKTTSLEIRQTDMTDLAHSLFLGNHGACCTAVGSGCNQFSAPTYIMNRLVSAIEVVDGKNFVGNSMIFIAEIDGVPSLMIDNIELSAKYQYNDGIRNAFFKYAQRLVAEIGKPDMPIYAGPHRHKLNMPEETKKERAVKILGSTGEQEIYVDFMTDHYTVDGEKVESIDTYEIKKQKN